MNNYTKYRQRLKKVYPDDILGELRGLQYLYCNLMSGAIVTIDEKLIMCLMVKDWTDG